MTRLQWLCSKNMKKRNQTRWEPRPLQWSNLKHRWAQSKMHLMVIWNNFNERDKTGNCSSHKRMASTRAPHNFLLQNGLRQAGLNHPQWQSLLHLPSSQPVQGGEVGRPYQLLGITSYFLLDLQGLKSLGAILQLPPPLPMLPFLSTQS